MRPYAIGFLAASLARAAAQEPPAMCEGVVEDAITGARLPGVNILLCRYQVSGRCAPSVADSEGRFAVPTPLSNYYVLASKKDYVEPGAYGEYANRNCGTGDQRPLKLLAATTFAGTVFDARGKPAAKALVELRSTRGPSVKNRSTADDHGNFTVESYARSNTICATSGAEVNYRKRVKSVPVSTCVTGVPMAPLRILLGKEKAYSIRGAITMLVDKTWNWGQAVWAVSDSHKTIVEGVVDPKSGAFKIHGLPAGDYTILARAGRGPGSDTGPFHPLYENWRQVRVGKRSKPVAVTLGPNVTVTGDLVSEGFQSKAPPRVYLDRDLPSYLSNSTMQYVPDANRFRISEVPPGTYRVVVAGPDPDVYVAAILANGTEAADGRILVDASQPAHLEIRLRKSTAAVEINVTGLGRFSGGIGFAIAIPEGAWDQPFRWVTAYLTTYRPRLEPLAPGTYFIFATNLSESNLDRWKDELAIHKASAVRVVVADGSTQTISIPRLDLTQGN